MKDKDLERHLKEWTSYQEELKGEISSAKTETQRILWLKERLKSLDRLLTSNGAS